MKNDSELNEYPSRRTFTKSIAATLISAPIAASVISCQTNTNRNQNTGTSTSATPTPTTTNPALIRVDECVKPPAPASEDHIPPFMIGEGGSFKVESGHELVDNPESISTGPRKWRYKLTGTTMQYGNIETVQPLIELEGYFDSRKTYVLANQKNALKIWLQPWDNSTQNWKLPAPSQTSEADILVQGKSGGVSYNSLFVEVDDKFSKKTSGRRNKKTRPHKRAREFGAKDDEVRIYRWAIVDSNDQIVHTGTVDEEEHPYEGFTFMLTFYHAT